MILSFTAVFRRCPSLKLAWLYQSELTIFVLVFPNSICLFVGARHGCAVLDVIFHTSVAKRCLAFRLLTYETYLCVKVIILAIVEHYEVQLFSINRLLRL